MNQRIQSRPLRFPARPDMTVTLLFNVTGVLCWALPAYTKGQISSRPDVICMRYVMHCQVVCCIVTACSKCLNYSMANPSLVTSPLYLLLK